MMEREIVEKIVQGIYEQREEVIKAFVAKYGCGPDEIEQVIQQGLNETRWFLRLRVDE